MAKASAPPILHDSSSASPSALHKTLRNAQQAGRQPFPPPSTHSSSPTLPPVLLLPSVAFEAPRLTTMTDSNNKRRSPLEARCPVVM